MHTIVEKKLLMLRPGEILPASNMARKKFDEKELKILAASISVYGIIEPVAVRKSTSGGYELISGERRLRAAIIAGMRRIPCVIHKVDDQMAAFYGIVENMQSCFLNMFEQAEYINRLIYDFHLTQAEVATRIGIVPEIVTAKIRLLRLNEEIRNIIIKNNLSEGHALMLLRLPDYLREEAAYRIVSDELSVTKSAELIYEMLNPSENSDEEISGNIKDDNREDFFLNNTSAGQQPVRKSAIGDLRLFTNSLSKIVSTMENAGVDVTAKRSETDKYIEYRVRIDKASIEPHRYKQLKIC